MSIMNRIAKFARLPWGERAAAAAMAYAQSPKGRGGRATTMTRAGEGGDAVHDGHVGVSWFIGKGFHCSVPH